MVGAGCPSKSRAITFLLLSRCVFQDIILDVGIEVRNRGPGLGMGWEYSNDADTRNIGQSH